MGGDLRAASSRLRSWAVFLWKSSVGTNGGEDRTRSMAIVLDNCHQLRVYAPLGRCPHPPSLSPLSSPSFRLCGLFLVVSPLVGVFFIVVIIVVLPTAAAFDWQFVRVGCFVLPQLHWCCLLLGRHACVVVGLNKVCGWMLNKVGCGGGKVVVGRQKTMTWQQSQHCLSAFGMCQEGWYMTCEVCRANKASMV